MGKLLAKGDVENHLQDQWFRLAPWLTIILFLRKTIQDSINVVRKCYPECSVDMHCMQEKIGKETFWWQTLLRSWKEWDASEVHARRLNAKEFRIGEKWWTSSSSQSQMEQLSCLKEIRVSENPPSLGINPKVTKSPKMTFEESRMGLSRWTQWWIDGEARIDFGLTEGNYMYRHHVELGVQLCVPKEEPFPVPLRYIDLIRRTHYDLSCVARKPNRRLLEHW